MANYPTSQNTDDNLYLAVNNLSTVLTDNPLAIGATTVNVSDASSFPSVGILTIELEAIHYTGKTATSFTGCTRAFDGTTATSHPQGVTVFHDIPAAHHNVLKDEIKAVTDDLRASQTVDLDDSVTPAATAASNEIRLNHIATAIKNATGEADWKTAPSETLSSLETSKAEDSAVVKLTGNQTVAGTKTFSSAPSMAGADMSSNKITSLSAGTVSTDAVNKGQLDAKGKLLQLVQNTTNTAFSVTSATYVDVTNHTVTITPSSTSNKVKLTFMFYVLSGDTNDGVECTIKRGSTDLESGNSLSYTYCDDTHDVRVTQTIVYLDSPSSTSATTYTLRAKYIVGSGGTIGGTNFTSVMMAEEIEG